MPLKPLKIIVIACLLMHHYEITFACGASAAQAPCSNNSPTKPATNNQIPVIAALQQQALKALPMYSPTNINSAAKDDGFVSNVSNPSQKNERGVVASIDRHTHVDRIIFHFPGERVGYQIDSKVYDSLVQSKKIIPIGTQFATVPYSLINSIKAMVISGTTLQKNLLLKEGSQGIELIATN